VALKQQNIYIILKEKRTRTMNRVENSLCVCEAYQLLRELSLFLIKRSLQYKQLVGLISLS
jgi:hypothetical protein